MRDFEYTLTKWEDKLEADKNWVNFKSHFHKAQLNLKKIRDSTMIQVGFHHANVLAIQINNNITK